jgi:hypothetical protein
MGDVLTLQQAGKLDSTDIIATSLIFDQLVLHCPDRIPDLVDGCFQLVDRDAIVCPRVAEHCCANAAIGRRMSQGRRENAGTRDVFPESGKTPMAFGSA